jgi:hypothetical protein
MSTALLGYPLWHPLSTVLPTLCLAWAGVCRQLHCTALEQLVTEHTELSSSHLLVNTKLKCVWRPGRLLSVGLWGLLAATTSLCVVVMHHQRAQVFG